MNLHAVFIKQTQKPAQNEKFLIASINILVRNIYSGINCNLLNFVHCGSFLAIDGRV